MKVLGNILWILLGGFLIFLFYLVGSFILCITIIGIPFGIQTLKLSILALFPFGKEIVRTDSSTGCLSLVMNILWILFAGMEIAITHVFLALLCAITIIGIPFAVQHIKLASLALVPFGAEIKEAN